jgi:hypothetical protein
MLLLFSAMRPPSFGEVELSHAMSVEWQRYRRNTTASRIRFEVLTCVGFPASVAVLRRHLLMQQCAYRALPAADIPQGLIGSFNPWGHARAGTKHRPNCRDGGGGADADQRQRDCPTAWLRNTARDEEPDAECERSSGGDNESEQ